MFAILSQGLVNKTWLVLHGVKLKMHKLKSLYSLRLKKALLAKWMFGKPKDIRVHCLGISLICKRVSDRTCKWTGTCHRSNKLCSFVAKKIFFSLSCLVILYYALLYITRGMQSLQHALGGRNPQTENLVLPWPFTSLLERNYRKALPLGGTMKAQIRGQVAHQ